MRIRVGGRDDIYRGRGGRGMSEFERLIHMIVSLQILFGSRRGNIGVPLLVIALCVGGWMAYKYWFDPGRVLERADQMWDSGDSKQRIEAIRSYKSLLRKKDPLDSNLYWLKDNRERLYRRIIQHQVLVDFDFGEAEAREWIYAAWDENLRDLRFQDREVKKFWTEVTDELRKKRRSGRFDDDRF